MHARGLPFVLESPWVPLGKPSIFLLPSALDLASLPGVNELEFDHCPPG